MNISLKNDTNLTKSLSLSYQVFGSAFSARQIRVINSLTPSSRLKTIINNGNVLKLFRDRNEILYDNLLLIDSRIPELLDSVLHYRYKKDKLNLTDTIAILNTCNPLKFDLSMGHPFYSVKTNAFLTAIISGLNSKIVWKPKYDLLNQIVIQRGGNYSTLYHEAYNRFQANLLNNSSIDWNFNKMTKEDCLLFEENGEFFIKVNLRVGIDIQ